MTHAHLKRYKENGMPTEYKGTLYKSRLEARTAYLLDILNIKKIYEEKSFLLPSGKIYLPDFYLPEINQYVECKGNLTQEVYDTLNEFFYELPRKQNEEKNEVILITRETKDWKIIDNMCGIDEVFVGLCPECKSHYFCSNSGNYKCKKCSKHSGATPYRWCGAFPNDNEWKLKSNQNTIEEYIKFLQSI